MPGGPSPSKSSLPQTNAERDQCFDAPEAPIIEASVPESRSVPLQQEILQGKIGAHSNLEKDKNREKESTSLQSTNSSIARSTNKKMSNHPRSGGMPGRIRVKIDGSGSEARFMGERSTPMEESGPSSSILPTVTASVTTRVHPGLLHPGSTTPNYSGPIDEQGFDEAMLLTDEVLPPWKFDDLDTIVPSPRVLSEPLAFVPTKFVDNRTITPPITGLPSSMLLQREQPPNPLRPVPQTSSATTTSSASRSLPPTTSTKPIPTHPRLISEEDIVQAMPATASAVFHIYDRRVNLDAHSSQSSLYSLLRSWVQDDPHRQIPPPGANLVEYSRPAPPGLSHRPPVEVPSVGSPHVMVEPHDMLSVVKKIAREAPPGIVGLRSSLVKKARRVKKQTRKFNAKGDAAARESLGRRGITLPQRVMYGEARNQGIFPS